MRSDRRAISEALGFILVFAIIISTVGVVYIGGFQSLNDARQFERMNNAERAFEVFADNIEDMTQRGAPSRATEVKLADATVERRAVDSITVNVSESGSPGEFENTTVEYQPIAYQSQTDTSNEIVYANGATFRSSSGGTVMNVEPPMTFRDVDGDGNFDHVILPVFRTQMSGGANITGDRTILVRTAMNDRSVLLRNASEDTAYDVTVNVSSDRAEPWRTYFEDEADADCSDPDNNATFASCDIENVDEVYVVRFAIDFEIGR